MIEVRRYQLHDGRVGVARTCLFRLCVYVGRHGTTLVIPLFGGDKRTPAADIRGGQGVLGELEEGATHASHGQPARGAPDRQ